MKPKKSAGGDVVLARGNGQRGAVPSDFGARTPAIYGARGFLGVTAKENLKKNSSRESALEEPRRM